MIEVSLLAIVVGAIVVVIVRLVAGRKYFPEDHDPKPPSAFPYT